MGLNILAWVKAKKYTDNAVSQSAALHREIVNSLPITGDDKVIYMVPITGSGDDNYNEYMWINGAYELIGNTRVDLTDYYNKTQVDAALSTKANSADTYTKTEVNTALNGKADTSAIPTALSDLDSDSTHRVVTDTEKTAWNGKSNFSGSYNDLSDKPTIPTPFTTSNKTFYNNSAITVNANSYANFDIDITRQGYTALSLNRIYISSSKLVISSYYLTSGQVYVRLFNPTSSNQTISKEALELSVLYYKN